MNLRAWMGQRKGRTEVYAEESIWGAVGQVQAAAVGQMMAVKN